MKKLIKHIISKMGYDVVRKKDNMLLISNHSLKPLLSDLFHKIMRYSDRPLNFLQIGAFDGYNNDLLWPYIVKYNWKGWAVEPHPDYHKKLAVNYSDYPGIETSQYAINVDHKSLVFYTISEKLFKLHPDAPHWLKQTSSYNLDVIMNSQRYLKFDLKPYIIEISVPCITLIDYILKEKIHSLDILAIDTEGYDYEILSSFPFTLLKPSIIIYEHKHLSQSAYEDSINLLIDKNYLFYSSPTDTYAIDHDIYHFDN